MIPYDILSAYYDTLIFDLIILFLFIKICFKPYLRYHLIFPLKINIEKENHSPSDNEGEKGKNKPGEYFPVYSNSFCDFLTN